MSPGAIDLDEIKTRYRESGILARANLWSFSKTGTTNVYMTTILMDDHPALIAAVEALRERVVELAGALEEIVAENENGSQYDLSSNAELFMLNIARAALSATPAEAAA